MDNGWLTLDRHRQEKYTRTVQEKKNRERDRIDWNFNNSLGAFFVIKQVNYLIYLFRVTLVFIYGWVLMGSNSKWISVEHRGLLRCLKYTLTEKKNKSDKKSKYIWRYTALCILKTINKRRRARIEKRPIVFRWRFHMILVCEPRHGNKHTKSNHNMNYL